MGWLIALGILVLLAVLPLGVSVKYGDSGTGVWITAGAVRFRVYPSKKDKKEEKAGEKPKKEEKKSSKTAAPQEEKGGSWKKFRPMVDVAVDLLRDLRRKLRVGRLQLHMTMAGDDPCDLAVNYGRANAAMAGLLAQLDRLLVIRKQDVRIDCDFGAEETKIFARLDLSITVGRLLGLAVRYGVRAFKIYRSIQNQQEGGANL